METKGTLGISFHDSISGDLLCFVGIDRRTRKSVFIPSLKAEETSYCFPRLKKYKLGGYESEIGLLIKKSEVAQWKKMQENGLVPLSQITSQDFPTIRI